MITRLELNDMRGIEHLVVQGLGRVNIIIGRNDVGKTTLLGALAFSSGAGALSWAHYLGHPTLKIDDYERVWRPLCRGGDASLPIRLHVGFASGETKAVTITIEKPSSGAGRVRYAEGGGPLTPTLLGRMTLESATPIEDGSHGWWSGPYPDSDALVIEPLKDLYTTGRSAQLAEQVRLVHPGVQRIDIVGDAIYVVLEGHPLPLPVSVLGDGSRRLLEFAIPAASAARHAFIDEVENGFHWSALRTVWDFLRESAIGQIFATTHREECIRIACEAFLAAGDDSLRIVRLDRHAGGHRAVLYSPESAMAAMDSGLEIRG